MVLCAPASMRTWTAFLLFWRSSGLNPMTCPINPAGFGTGHSLAFTSGAPSSGPPPPPTACSPLVMTFLRLLLTGLPFSSTMKPSFEPSASCRVGAGHGRRCGRPTTRKETASVAPNSVVVKPERGCSAGGMMREWRPRAVMDARNAQAGRVGVATVYSARLGLKIVEGGKAPEQSVLSAIVKRCGAQAYQRATKDVIGPLSRS